MMERRWGGGGADAEERVEREGAGGVTGCNMSAAGTSEGGSRLPVCVCVCVCVCVVLWFGVVVFVFFVVFCVHRYYKNPPPPKENPPPPPPPHTHTQVKQNSLNCSTF